ncbi:MAG: signal peptidase I [Candidatus Nanopelagicales bacterium]|nr:signal peptidase I [Candidatus Nanopelagicales bacterium]
MSGDFRPAGGSPDSGPESVSPGVPGSGEETSDQSDGGSRRVKGFFREVGIVVLAALVLSVVMRTFFVQAFYVPSQSMEDTLLPNDRILASKISTRLSGVDRGEVVVFKDPGGWLTTPKLSPNPVQSVLEFLGLLPSSSGDDLVKRVIGVAGDRVQCCDPQGRIVLNGVSLDEPYIKPGVRTDQVEFDVIVPPDNVFVMGDNRAESADSRYHLQANDGGVPVGNVVGRVILKIWPLSQISTIGTPSVFEQPSVRNSVGSGTAAPGQTPG